MQISLGVLAVAYLLRVVADIAGGAGAAPVGHAPRLGRGAATVRAAGSRAAARARARHGSADRRGRRGRRDPRHRERAAAGDGHGAGATRIAEEPDRRGAPRRAWEPGGLGARHRRLCTDGRSPVDGVLEGEPVGEPGGGAPQARRYVDRHALRRTRLLLRLLRAPGEPVRLLAGRCRTSRRGRPAARAPACAATRPSPLARRPR